MGRLKPVFCLGVVMALGGCGTAEKRAPITPPPEALAAPPPAVRALPLPPLPSAPGLFPDSIDLLIHQADAFYASGKEEYRAGNLDKAKEKFDQAISVLLESHLDLSADDRLDDEFNKLVEDIHGLEVAALESGELRGGHQDEPTAIESFAGLTFRVDPRVKQRAQHELESVHSDLPLVSNDLVDGVMTYFQGRGRGFIQNILKRLGNYQSIFSDALSKEGLPLDLVYLAAGESAFNPFAVSKKSCVGIWQFSAGTGAMYGLKRDRWVDERKDPVKSTEAAARHLKDLYQTFGDWYLAMAAYDSGPLTVQRAIEKTGYADYWTLRNLHALPQETENYVPIILATALIAKDPTAFGFDVTPDSPLVVDQVAISDPTDLRLVAELIDHPVEELIQLNPSLLRWTTPPNNPDFVLNLPAGTGELFQHAVASIPSDKRIWWRAYKVDGGETVSSIAKKYRISTVALADANGIDRNSDLEQGARLVLPLSPGTPSSLARVRESGPRHAVSYKVRAGDTLELISDRFDVSPSQIRQWNHMKTSHLASGRILRVYVAGSSSRGHTRRASVNRLKKPAPKLAAQKKAVANRKPQAGEAGKRSTEIASAKAGLAH